MNAAAARELQKQSLTAEMSRLWGMAGDVAVWVYDYLDSYGYIDTLSKLKVEDVAAGVLKFQEITGFLKPDAKPLALTQRAMELPRCGCADVQRVGGTINKWGLKEITYGFASYLPQLSVADQKNLWDSEITKAWEDECGLVMKPAASGERPNVLIDAGNRVREELGRAGGVLAWCELPSGTDFRGQVLMKFDTAEAWKIDRSRVGILYTAVACHELGHGIGLDHGGQGLMQPFYSEGIATPQQGYDVNEAVKRYGKPSVVTPPPTGGEPQCRVVVDGYLATGWKKVA